MSLINKLFGGDKGKDTGSSTQFAESRMPSAVDQTKSQNAPRRELVRVVLRETMRKHGIPTDWMDCRSLSVLTRQHKAGMHVQFLVLKGDHQLLSWVHAFQESFWEQITRMDPTAHDWLFSVGWEFYGKSVQGFEVMPDAQAWKKEPGDTAPMDPEPHQRPEDAGDTLPSEMTDDEVAADLQALQAAMSTMPGELVDLPDAPARDHRPKR